MRKNPIFKTSRMLVSLKKVVGVILALLVAGFSQVTFAQQSRGKTFASASEAVQALYEAAKNNDEQAVQAILGAGYELTSSGDEAIDKIERDQFAQEYQEMHRLVREPGGITVLYIGAVNWPFPVPLIVKNGKWRFDADAGTQEITARRIGENESIAIQVCQDLAAHPQTQSLGFFIDLAAIDPIPRPSQNLCPLALAHAAERTEKSPPRKPPLIDEFFRFLHRATNSYKKIQPFSKFGNRDASIPSVKQS